MAFTVSMAYTPSVTFGDSSPYTGEPTPRRGVQADGEGHLETRLFFPVSIVVRKPAAVNGFPHFLLFLQF